MRFEDFEYDGKRLSELGFMVCEFGTSSSGVDVKSGAELSLSTVSDIQGTKNYHISSKYSGCLTDTFQICKDPCADCKELSADEIRMLSRWLNRKGFHKFKILSYEYSEFYFEASFNVSCVTMAGTIYGLELSMVTNRPFALKESEDYILEFDGAEQSTSLVDESDDEGYVYPRAEITVGSDAVSSGETADLEVTSTLADDSMKTVIKNCSSDEVITLDYPLIESSLSSHKIQNDFNWNFIRIGNSGSERVNKITVSLPCTIKLSYSPAVKIGL